MANHDKTSIWKKEISFRRKPNQAPKAVPVWPQEAAQAAPAQPEPKTSVWKKEISFGRKGKPKPVALPPVEAPPAPVTAGSEPEAKTSVWKKEISFGRKSKPKVESTSAPVEAVLPAEAAVPPVSPTPEAESVPVAPLPPVSPSFQPVAPDPVPSDSSEPVLPPAGAEAGPVPPPVSPTAEPVPPVAPGRRTARCPAGRAGGRSGPGRRPGGSRSSRGRGRARRVRRRGRRARAGPRPSGRARLRGTVEAVPPRAPRGEASLDKASKEHGQLVGLKLGASQIAAAQVVNKGGPKIVRMARMPLERGVVVGGELREPEQLASALKTFFRKNKLPRNCVRLGISNNRIGVRTFEISGISDPKQLANAVRFRAQEALPIPLDEAVLDYRILDDRLGEDGDRVCRVLLVVAHKELVERYVSACRKAGLKLVGIDLEAFALLRALSDPTQTLGEDAAVVCVSIGHDRSTLAVSDGRLCEFTRVLAWGGSALDAAVARVLDITPSAAVPIKHALSLGEEGEAAGLDARHADEARRAMVGELQSFARELVASLRFYQEQPKSLGIVEIMITGGAAACGGLAPELERLIGIPVRVADPLARVKAPRTLEGSDAASIASMAVAVGLGIED